MVGRRVLTAAAATAACASYVAAGANECPLAYFSTGPPFNAMEVQEVRRHFLRNLDLLGSGAVVAAPDRDTGPGGDYFFHWERDGALSMSTLLRTARSLAEVEGKFQHYIIWVLKVQNQTDPHGIDVRTEPKYLIPSGKVFAGKWCRPQTDGPGLRALTLARYGLALLRDPNPVRRDYVRDTLWTGSAAKNGGAVKYDLDWVAEHWQEESCDLWEEIRSDDFFWGRYTMRAGLHVGAQFAEAMGDTATAARYRSVKADIEKTLPAHYNSTGKFVYESTNRPKDAAVIEAFSDGYLDDNIFAPLSKEVLETVITLNDLFCSAYEINTKDTKDGIPGILYGRYEGDSYAGGNPWVLLTATLAELIYRQASAVMTATVSDEIYSLLTQAYGVPPGLSGRQLGDALMGAADGVLLRVKHHAVLATPEGTTRREHTGGMHMAEQIERKTGQLTSAEDLTWNYANILKAVHQRELYVQGRGKVTDSPAFVDDSTIADRIYGKPGVFASGFAWWVWALAAACIATALGLAVFLGGCACGGKQGKKVRRTRAAKLEIAPRGPEEMEAAHLLAAPTPQNSIVIPGAYPFTVPVPAMTVAAATPVYYQQPLQVPAYTVLQPTFVSPTVVSPQSWQ